MTHLASSELAVMNLIWQSTGRMTAREIREALYSDQAKAQHGTVQRLLQRLEEKGFVSRDKSLSVHFFSATVSREGYGGQQLETLADKLTSGSIAPLITNLVEQNKISEKDLQRIRGVLEQAKKTSDSNSSIHDENPMQGEQS